jgi:hypothetical protein
MTSLSVLVSEDPEARVFAKTLPKSLIRIWKEVCGGHIDGDLTETQRPDGVFREPAHVTSAPPSTRSAGIGPRRVIRRGYRAEGVIHLASGILRGRGGTNCWAVPVVAPAAKPKLFTDAMARGGARIRCLPQQPLGAIVPSAHWDWMPPVAVVSQVRTRIVIAPPPLVNSKVISRSPAVRFSVNAPVVVWLNAGPF